MSSRSSRSKPTSARPPGERRPRAKRHSCDQPLWCPARLMSTFLTVIVGVKPSVGQCFVVVRDLQVPEDGRVIAFAHISLHHMPPRSVPCLPPTSCSPRASAFGSGVPRVADFAGWPGAVAASRRQLFPSRGRCRGSRRWTAMRRSERAHPSIPLSAAARRSPERPATRGVWARGGQGRPAPAALHCEGRRSRPPPPRSATGLWASDLRASVPAHRFGDTTRPRLSRANRRGRSRRPRSRAASARRGAAPSATTPNRGEGDGDTRRHRPRRDRRRAPRLRLRLVPQAQRRFARPAGIRLRRSARAAFCCRARGPACSSRPGCTRGPSLAAAAR
jgi:hypothetical protein